MLVCLSSKLFGIITSQICLTWVPFQISGIWLRSQDNMRLMIAFCLHALKRKSFIILEIKNHSGTVAPASICIDTVHQIPQKWRFCSRETVGWGGNSALFTNVLCNIPIFRVTSICNLDGNMATDRLDKGIKISKTLTVYQICSNEGDVFLFVFI